MPLYTYLACYRGGSYLDQDSKSNFKGFAATLIGAMPEHALPGMDKAAIKSAVEKTCLPDIVDPNSKPGKRLADRV